MKKKNKKRTGMLLRSLIVVTLLLGTLFAWTGHAHAQMPDPDPTNGSAVASSTRTAADVQQATVTSITQILRLRFSPFSNAFTLPGAPNSTPAASATQTGIAGGDETPRWSVWSNVANNWIENDFTATAYDGDTVTVAGGIDHQFSRRFTAGISTTFSNTDIDTPFNGGGSDTDGVSVLPYVALTINDWLSFDGSAGYAWNETDQVRVTGGTRITGEQDSSGYIATANLKASKWRGSWLLTGQAGIVANEDSRSAFAESDGTVVVGTTNDLLQGRFGVGAGYWRNQFLPSVMVTYVHDFEGTNQTIAGAAAQPANDDDAVIVEGSVFYYGTGQHDGLTLGLTSSIELARTDIENISLGLNLRYAF